MVNIYIIFLNIFIQQKKKHFSALAVYHCCKPPTAMIAFAFLLALLTMCDLSIAPSSSSVCHKRNSCKCVNDDGMGYDLEVLGTSKYALETLGRDESNLTFYFHPCGDIDIEHHPIEVNKTAEICKASSVGLLFYKYVIQWYLYVGIDPNNYICHCYFSYACIITPSTSL